MKCLFFCSFLTPCLLHAQGRLAVQDMMEFHLRIGVTMPQFVAFLECLFQTIAARLGDKASAKVLCYWSIQFGRLLTAMGEVCWDSSVDKRLSLSLRVDSSRTEHDSCHEGWTDNALWVSPCGPTPAVKDLPLDFVYPFDQ